MKPLPQFIAHDRKKGILCILFSWIFFTISIGLSRTASEQSSVFIVLLFQNSIGFLLTLPWMIQKGVKSLYLSKIKVIAIRSLAGFLSYALIFLAVQKISLVNTLLLSNSSPLFIPLIIWLWRGIKIPKGLWIGILLGFVGIAFILRPTQEIMHSGAFFAIGAAVCLSISAIAKRRLIKTESKCTILFYYFLISILLSIPFSIETWKPLEKDTLLLLCIIGVAFACGQGLFLSALKYEKPSYLSAFNYSAVVYGAIFQWIFWGDFPDWCTVMGIIVVCTGGILTITHGAEMISSGKDS